MKIIATALLVATCSLCFAQTAQRAEKAQSQVQMPSASQVGKGSGEQRTATPTSYDKVVPSRGVANAADTVRWDKLPPRKLVKQVDYNSIVK